jgi:uncharacterized protein (DUF1501 family)
MSNRLLHVTLNQQGQLTRRNFLELASAGLVCSASGALLQAIQLHAADLKRAGRSCILVFLNGAPSQLETWDPKPGTANGGPTKAISTRIAGVQFAEYWPKLAAAMDQLSVIRTIAGKEAAHERGQFHLRTGYRMGPTKYPHFGSIVAQRLGDPQAELPNFVSIGNTISSGFLGVKTAPFVINKAGTLPENVQSSVNEQRRKRRLEALYQQDQTFALSGARDIAEEHAALYQKAAQLMTSARLKAFTLDGENDKTRQDYGNHAFGQGCLVARRLVEAGVPFVEVQRGGWDMHENLWQNIPKTAAEVDQGVSALIADLKSRGLLERTLVLVLGEFGRTPKINQRTPNVGRDHWARNFNALIAGGGLRGGVCVGTTNADGQEITDRAVDVADLFATLCHSLQLDPDEELITPEGRPIRIVDDGLAIRELLS